MDVIVSSGSGGGSSDAPAGDMSFERERERIHRQMLSSVSHDLKTPLASIIGSLEVFERLHDSLPADKQAMLIAVALQEAYRLDTFITNILDMAKIENNMIKVRREKTELADMAEQCVAKLRHRLNGCQIALEIASPVTVMTDPVLAVRTLGLLLDNAIKHGGPSPSVRIEGGMDGETFAYLRVRDNGPGIPAAQMKSIFSKYTRLQKEDQQKAGTGLGLAIASGLMKLLGGHIAVTNHPEGGAVFTVYFPLHE